MFARIFTVVSLKKNKSDIAILRNVKKSNLITV